MITAELIADALWVARLPDDLESKICPHFAFAQWFRRNRYAGLQRRLL